MTSIGNIALAPIESWEVEKVLPYPHNHKVHPERQIKMLAKSIKNQGLNDPITVDMDGYIISGHGRFEAIKFLGWEKVPVRHLHMITKEQADKLRIAANKTSSNEYDFDVLQKELNRLGGLGMELDDIGLDEKELSMMVDDLGEINLDMMTEDIGEAVDAFEAKTESEAEELISEGITLSKAFGIKKIPLGARSVATKFMGAIEEKTGLKDGEALVAYMESVIND